VRKVNPSELAILVHRNLPSQIIALKAPSSSASDNMSSLRDDILGATEHPDAEKLRDLLHSTSLTGLTASGLSLEDILAAPALCNDYDVGRSCLAAGVQVTERVALRALSRNTRDLSSSGSHKSEC
jgi:hypothetical protein